MKSKFFIFLLASLVLLCSCASTNKYPKKYVLAKDVDFIGEEDGKFIYIGKADYVIIPKKIKGVVITKTGTPFVGEDGQFLFRNRSDIKGVAFQESKNIVDMSYLFYNNISNDLELQYLDTTNVTNMSYMFAYYRGTSLDLSYLRTSLVTDMSGMFSHCNLTFPIDLSHLDTLMVTNMSKMFENAYIGEVDFSPLFTGNVNDMSSMFAGTIFERLDLRSFDT